MPLSNRAVFDPVLAKLNRLAQLQQADRDAFCALTFDISSKIPANHYLVREGGPSIRCCVLLAGYACRSKMTSNGTRQIVSFHMPGDILDLQHLLLSRADHNVETITEASIAWVLASDLRRVAQERPLLSEAMWCDTLVDASIFREWVLNIGRRSGKARVAHLLCEFASRRNIAGLGPLERFELPMNQEQIADATGLTSVHVNRMLRELDQEGVIIRTRRVMQIVNWPRMCRIADFDTTYLHAAA